jgi:hypothetical protein
LVFMSGAEQSEGLLSSRSLLSHVIGELEHVTANRGQIMPAQSKDARRSSVSQNHGHTALGPILQLPQLVLVVGVGRLMAELYWFLERLDLALCL